MRVLVPLVLGVVCVLQGHTALCGSKEAMEALHASAQKEVEAEAARLLKQLKAVDGQFGLNPSLTATLEKTFVNTYLFTIQKTLKVFALDNSTYVTTGDIGEMWLRDSCAELRPYVALVKAQVAANNTNSATRQVLESAMGRMVQFILSDIYGSSFYPSQGPSQNQGPDKGECPPAANCPNCRCTVCAPVCGDWTMQRDFEVDSLMAVLMMHHAYYQATGSTAHVSGPAFQQALVNIMAVLHVEMYHNEKSPYVFYRPSPRKVKDGVGLVWTFARPSDDSAMGYNIPDNIMIVTVLKLVAGMLKEAGTPEAVLADMADVAATVEAGIETYGTSVVNGEKIYAYEVTGFETDSHVNEDDANLPNLLWMHHLGYEDHLQLYNNTRRFVLSSGNVNYFSGSFATGLGSQHASTGLRPINPGPFCIGKCIWHLGLVYEGMTTTDRAVKRKKLQQLLTTLAGQNLMHEGFDPNQPSAYNRDWFGWADSTFALWVINDWIKPYTK